MCNLKNIKLRFNVKKPLNGDIMSWHMFQKHSKLNLRLRTNSPLIYKKSFYKSSSSTLLTFKTKLQDPKPFFRECSYTRSWIHTIWVILMLLVKINSFACKSKIKTLQIDLCFRFTEPKKPIKFTALNPPMGVKIICDAHSLKYSYNLLHLPKMSQKSNGNAKTRMYLQWFFRPSSGEILF